MSHASRPESGPGFCPACGAQLSPEARFCHRCGARAAGALARRERVAWMVAGAAVLLAALALVWRSGSFRTAPPPEMGNAGNPGLSTRAPDISNMSPEERFLRLWDRVERAASSGDTTTVRQFAPMALGAYAQLPSADNDQRFHAALIHLAAGSTASAQALADTIQAGVPGHLFAYLIRAEVAERSNDLAALSRSYRDFLAHYDAELKAARGEYAEHRPLLDEFRTRAQAAGAKP